MALQNDPRLFTGGNVVLDSRPHLQLYAQLKQREQAKQDALDDYVRNLNKNINPAGMRNQERAVFEDKLKRWQEFGMQNKENLRNPRKDNGAASMQFQADYQDLQNLIAESKGEEEKKKPLVEIMTDPAKRDRLNEDDVFPRVQAHDQPIYTQDPKTGQWMRDPNRRSFNVADIDFDPKPFDQNKFFQGLDDVKPSKSSQSVVKNPKDLTQTVTTISEFTPEDKETIAVRTIGEYGQDKSFKKLIKDLPQEERATLNQYYKEAFGQDAQSDAQLAVGMALRGKQLKTEQTEIKDDNFARQKAMEDIRNANRRGLLYLRNKLDKEDEEANDLWIDNYVESLVNDARTKGQKKTYKYKNGQSIQGSEIQLDPVMTKALGINEKNKGTLIITDEGEFIPVYYETDDSYNPKKSGDSYVVDSDRTRKISQDQIKLSLGKTSAGVKQTNMEMNSQGRNPSQVKHPLPKGKPRTVQQGGFTYTWNENTGQYE